MRYVFAIFCTLLLASCATMHDIGSGNAPYAPPSLQVPLSPLTSADRLARGDKESLDPLYPRPGMTYAISNPLGTWIEYWGAERRVYFWKRGFKNIKRADYAYTGWPTKLASGEKYYHSFILSQYTIPQGEGKSITDALDRKTQGKHVLSFVRGDVFGLSKRAKAPFDLNGCTVPKPMIQAKAFRRTDEDLLERAERLGVARTRIVKCR
jgi:hypothetical protein